MATATATPRKVARLSIEDGVVIVTPRDRDLFLMSAEKATEACQEAQRQDDRIKRFESEFLVPIHNWCLARKQQVRACYISVQDGHVQVFVVTLSVRFDFNLAAEIAEFERNLARAGWRVGVNQLPEAESDSLATFINVEKALEVYAQGEPSSCEGGK